MVGRLENKVAIITGAAGGIGAATGLLFCEEGGRVVLVDSDSDALRVTVSRIRDTVPGARVVAVVADVGKEETASEVVAETRKAFGTIDVLANIAGIRAYEPQKFALTLHPEKTRLIEFGRLAEERHQRGGPTNRRSCARHCLLIPNEAGWPGSLKRLPVFVMVAPSTLRIDMSWSR